MTRLGFMSREILSQLEITHKLGAALKHITTQIFSMICTIAADISSIRTIVMRLDRGPSDEHFVLEDITGRVFPIHLKIITSWEVLEFILTERFRGKKGARRVKRKLYSLQESNTRREIDVSTPWESAFLPYQKVNMSFICKETADKSMVEKLSSCSFCKTPSSGDTGVEVEWKANPHSSS
jgi:hypothetical protein